MSKVTKIIFGLFAAYLLNCVYVIYTLFNPQRCAGNGHFCIHPTYTGKEASKLKISIFCGPSRNSRREDLTPVWNSENNSIVDHYDISVNVSVPLKTRRNGSLFAFVFVHPKDQTPFGRIDEESTVQSFQLTKHIVPHDKAFNLIEGSGTNVSAVPVTHMYPKLVFYIATEDISFDKAAIPSDIYHLLRISSKGKYLPLLYVDGLSPLDRHLLPVGMNSLVMPLRICYAPISLGRLRIWSSVEQTLGKMKDLGFTDNDLDELKGIFTDTNLYFLGLTFAVSILHLLFDVLAFKNDINFWKNKKTMEGMSTRTVVWRCVSTTIIFLYLMDEKTSLLVLVPAGVGAVIELWKVFKALKIEVAWNGWRPGFSLGVKSKSEQETEEFDAKAMKYLSYALYPLLLGGAIYSLVYQPHKSWYSWVIRSLVNGVYAFGFLFMLPQLFVNYKLKSVAHLPWRAFMYKAFNTFIDDIFAFIITMPTVHRLACFRDDLVFLVYLYQRWLYPVDKARTNEYGMSFVPDVVERANESETKTAKESKKKR